MPTVLQHRRGTTTQNNSFTGAVGELTIDTTLGVVVVQDGTTQGGFPAVNTTAAQTVYNKTFPVISGVTVHSGNLVANSGTASSSTSTGALVVAGGAGISGALYVGGNLVVSGATTTINNTVYETTEYVNTIDATTVRAVTLGNTGATLTGTLSTASQPNITTLAGVTSIGASGSTTLTGTLSTATQNSVTTMTGLTTLGTSSVTTTAAGNFTVSGTFTGGAPAGSLTGATLASGVTASSLTSVGTLTGLTVSGAILASTANTINIGSTTNWFNNIYGTAIHSLYADLAENYTADADYKPGTVVVFGGSAEITVTTQSHDTRVAGIVSTAPAYLMNEATTGLPVALTGRVPCQVQGPVTKGQVLVTSTTAGVAKAIDNSKFLPGCVVGKALEAININTIETIEVVVGRF